jgi:hypothetical protein
MASHFNRAIRHWETNDPEDKHNILTVSRQIGMMHTTKRSPLIKSTVRNKLVGNTDPCFQFSCRCMIVAKQMTFLYLYSSVHTNIISVFFKKYFRGLGLSQLRATLFTWHCSYTGIWPAWAISVSYSPSHQSPFLRASSDGCEIYGLWKTMSRRLNLILFLGEMARWGIFNHWTMHVSHLHLCSNSWLTGCAVTE